jgi:uncharacterized membrane protein
MQEVFLKLVVAGVLLSAGAGMADYEWARVKTGRPLLSGHPAVQVYWMGYLSLFLLGIIAILSAIFK